MCVCVFVLAQLPLLIPKNYGWCFDYLIASADFFFLLLPFQFFETFYSVLKTKKKRRSKFVPREGRRNRNRRVSWQRLFYCLFCYSRVCERERERPTFYFFTYSVSSSFVCHWLFFQLFSCCTTTHTHTSAAGDRARFWGWPCPCCTAATITTTTTKTESQSSKRRRRGGGGRGEEEEEEWRRRWQRIGTCDCFGFYCLLPHFWWTDRNSSSNRYNCRETSFWVVSSQCMSKATVRRADRAFITAGSSALRRCSLQ